MTAELDDKMLLLNEAIQKCIEEEASREAGLIEDVVRNLVNIK